MTPFRKLTIVSEDPYDVAASYVARESLEGLSASESADRDRWLERDPAHRMAYDNAHIALAIAAAGAADPEMLAMRTAALAARKESSITPWRLIAMGTGVAALLFLSLFYIAAAKHTTAMPAQQVAVAERPGQLATQSYTTAVGERSAIALPDGSVATLDTDSAIRVAYTAQERAIVLIKGQALFEVAKHKRIPFQVYAKNHRITAVGTKFNVRLQGDDVKVALLEGVIKVTTQPSPGKLEPVAETVTMAAGEVLDARPMAPITVVAANTEKLASWRAGVLVFSDIPLAEAVAEMNRYTSHPIVLADNVKSGLRVSGVFKTGDPEHFAETMTKVFPLKVDEDSDGATILTAKKSD